MSKGFRDPPRDRAHRREVDRDALVQHARALHRSVEETRAASRQIVSRCIEDRLDREHQRVRRASASRPAPGS